MGEEWAFEKWGLSVRKVSRAYARENQLEDETGVIVIGVQAGFPAAVSGLAVGDIITKVDQQPVTGLDVLKQIYQSFDAKPGSLLLLTTHDRRVSLYVLKP
jgi:serine protease Do